MAPFPLSVILVLLLLTSFLILSAALRYVVRNPFIQTRLTMTFFFLFVVTTLSVAFWPYALATFPFSIPAVLLGALLGHVIGVHAEREKLRVQGLEHYMEHFAHIHLRELKALTWWSIINFYSVMSALLLINLVGLSTVIYAGAQSWAIVTSVVGAFLLGTIIPYLAHLWSIRPTHPISKTTREA